jgi:hypothetical protein
MLHLTSLLFGTNAAHAFFRNKFFYAGLFILLMVTSVLWHSSPKLELEFMTVFWMDQAAIVAVILMTLFYAQTLKGLYLWIMLGLVGSIVALAYYLCTASWSRSYPIEHGTLHLLSSLCFHTVLGSLGT